MNKTESRCLAWLLGQGYATADITYQRRRSPVFLTADGRGWEPKLVRSGNITFTRKQLTQATAHPNCSVVLFREHIRHGPDGDLPPDILPLSAITPGYYGHYRILVLEEPRARGGRKPMLAKTSV